MIIVPEHKAKSLLARRGRLAANKSQSVVLSVDIKQTKKNKAIPSGYETVINGAREHKTLPSKERAKNQTKSIILKFIRNY